MTRRALWGWSPPAPAAVTPWQRRVDRFLTSGWTAVYFIGVIVLLNLAPHLATRWDLGLVAVASLAGGTWCAHNFWRCRQVHCVVTAAGWLGTGLLAGVEAAMGRSLISGGEQTVLLAVLAAAIAFELLWWRVRGTNAIRRR
jgi:hypothetical protein